MAILEDFITHKMHNLENKNQIAAKLEKETQYLCLLKERMDKYHGLANSMSSILLTFDERLGKLEQTILPVYNQTEQLQKRQSNLDSTLQCLSRVLAHYDASQDVCNLVHSTAAIDGQIGEFLMALNKLDAAKHYFLNNNPQSVELENVTSLFNTGSENLNNYFKSLLRKHSSPLKPIDLLDLIYIEDDSSSSQEEFCSSIKQISPNTREELNTIANWLDNKLRREYIQIYADERSDVVYRSLQMLKDHQKSGSWGNEALKPRKNEPRKSTTTRLHNIFERKANKMFLKATQTLEQSTGFSLKKSTTHSDNHLTIDDYSSNGSGGSSSAAANTTMDGGGDQELEKYLVLLLGLQRLLIWERQLLNDIIPSSRHNDVFSRLAQNSIEMVVKDAELITNRVLRSIAKKEWSAALGVFSALKHVLLLQPDIERTCDSYQRQQLAGVLHKLQQTGAKALEQFLELVKGETGTNLVGMSSTTLSGGYSNVPKDATVHELTSNTIWFIEHLFDHFDIIGGILQQDPFYLNQLDSMMGGAGAGAAAIGGQYNNKSITMASEEKNKMLLGLYIKKVLSELNLTILSKCEQYNDLATRHLFRLNNINYILKSLQRSNLMDLVTMAESDCERNYQELIQDLKRSYQKSWSKLITYISPLDDLPRAINGKVKDKERAILKERFSNFNKEFEEACKAQRGISVPDVILREGLKRDNAEYLIPQYNAFYEIYSDVQFSKNQDKYVKYRPQEINAILNNLFDDRV